MNYLLPSLYPVRNMKDKGFTLIETLIVMAVVFFVFSILFIRTTGITDYGKETATRREMEELRKAIVGDPSIYTDGRYVQRGYLGDVGSLPDSLGDLVTKPATVPNWDKFTEKGWNGPYIQNSGYDKDAWGNSYIYDKGNAKITSKGKDGILGTSDDIVIYLLQ